MNLYLWCGQAGISDHLLPILIDHNTTLAINKMRWSSRSGEGWSKQAFLPVKECAIQYMDNLNITFLFS